MKEILKTAKKIFDKEIENVDTCDSQVTSYSIKLYKHLLSLARDTISIIDTKKGTYTSLPKIARSFIEGVIDLENLRNYGEDYLYRLILIQNFNSYNFYKNNANLYKTDKITRKLDEIKDCEYNILIKIKNNNNTKLNNDIIENIHDENNISFKNIKRSLNNKVSLISDESSIYRSCYYLMSLYVHNSIIFINDIKQDTNKEKFQQLLKSIFVNGLNDGLLSLSLLTDIYLEDLDNYKNMQEKIENYYDLKNAIENALDFNVTNLFI